MYSSRSALGNSWHLPNRVAYVVDHSLPYSSDGYAIRTHEVARALSKNGLEVVVFNRPGRPWDIPGFDLEKEIPLDTTIEGVRYILLPVVGHPKMERRDRLRLTERLLFEAFDIFRPSAVMAASNWENAKPAQVASKEFGIPFFYEVRGFWEMSRVAHDPSYSETRDYAHHREQEARVANSAKGVFTLTEEMRSELVHRGVARDKIRLVPNGVRSDPPPAPIVRRESIGCTAKRLLGYIGSLSLYEGLEDLIRVVALMREQKEDVAAMIVGSAAPAGIMTGPRIDPAASSLQKLAQDLSVVEHIHFVPQIPWDQVGAYYSLCDAIIMPRRSTAVTEMVAPLKPYAAVPFGVPVFMTNIPPLDKVADDIRGSLFSEGDLADLSNQLKHAFKTGHPALTTPLPPSIYWQNRVAPMVSALDVVSVAGSARLSARHAMAPKKQTALPDFDLAVVPEVALGHDEPVPVAAIGPCLSHRATASSFVALTRATILSHLSTGVPGIFLIDWVGLQLQKRDQPNEANEWDDLWSIVDMRLNRQVMDACRIANDRGWQIKVTGPVHRSSAPLFRTVADLFEVIYPSSEEVAS